MHSGALCGEEGRFMGYRDLGYRLYERRLETSLAGKTMPRHVGVMCDGNRRWARSAGHTDVSKGHRKGADKIFELLQWCKETGVEVVTLWLLSTDNLSRPQEELGPLLDDHRGHGHRPGRRGLAREPGGRARPAARPHRPGAQGRRRGDRRTIPACWSTWPSATAGGARSRTRSAVLLIEHASRGTTIEQLAEILDVEHIAEHLYTAGQPDPDLVIRTSGEQRLGGFLLWQSTHSEFYFCDAYWPAFRKVDFLRALRSYSERNRRFGA